MPLLLLCLLMLFDVASMRFVTLIYCMWNVFNTKLIYARNRSVRAVDHVISRQPFVIQIC